MTQISLIFMLCIAHNEPINSGSLNVFRFHPGFTGLAVVLGCGQAGSDN